MMILNSKTWDYIGAVKGLVSVLRDPNDTPAVFQITRGLRNTGAFQRMMERARSDEATARLIAERYAPPVADLDALLRLPEGSLGHTHATLMRKRGLDVEFYPPVEVTDDFSYVELRLSQTHDIWHTVTGFGIDPLGEIGLQAFALAQIDSPLSAALIGGGLLQSLTGRVVKGTTLITWMDAVTQGWTLGRAAAPLLGQRWETGWERPLDDWRRELRITPATDPLAN